MNTIEHTARLHIRDADERIIEGVIVPYGETIETNQGRERFVPGAFADTTPGDVVLKVEHEGVPIGKALTIEDTPGGALAAFRVSRTERGNEVLVLAADGVFTGLSVGFIPRHSKLTAGDVVEHRRVDLIETSITHRPAYKSALVTSVRSQEDSMPENTTEATPALTIDAVTDAIEAVMVERTADTDARLRTLEAATTEPAAEVRTATALDWFVSEVMAANGDETEKRALADMTGTTGGTGDASGIVPDSYWAGGLVNGLDGRRPMFANAGRIPYPSAGTQVTLPVVTQQPTVSTHTQKAEASSTAMIIGTESFPIVFGAGAQNVALELVAQSNPAALSVLFDSLLRAYAYWSESVIESTVLALGTATGAGLDLSTIGSFVADVVEQSEAIYAATGAPGDRLALPTDDWIKFLSLTDGADRRQMSVMGSTNADGSASLTAESVDFAGIRVFHMPHRATGAAVQFNTASLKTADSGPNRLQQTNVPLIGVDVAVWGGIITAPVIEAGVITYKA